MRSVLSIRLSREVERELSREAARLERGLSWLVQRAWLIARDEIAQLPARERPATSREPRKPPKLRGPPKPRVRSPATLESDRLRGKLARARKAELGICYACSEPALTGRVHCRRHLDGIRAACSRLFERRRAAGQCRACGQPSPDRKALCDRCFERQSDRQRARQRQLEAAVREVAHAYRRG